MAEMRKNKLLLLLALVLSVILIGGLILVITAPGTVSEVAATGEVAAVDDSTIGSSEEQAGPASGARAAGIAGLSGSDESLPAGESPGSTDGNVGEESPGSTDGDTGTSSDGPTDASSSSEGGLELVDALTETNYSCPDGSAGSASASGSDCVSTASESTDAFAMTSYSCPSGSTGNPTEQNPTCELTDTVPAVADGSTYSCPPGSAGTPTGGDPFCTVASEAQVDALTDTTYRCPRAASGAGSGVDLVCTGIRPGTEDVPAQTRTIYSCPPPLSGTPDESDPTCSKRIEPTTIDATETVLYSCQIGGPTTTEEPYCEQTLSNSFEVVDPVPHYTYTCPAGSGGNPDIGKPYCILHDASSSLSARCYDGTLPLTDERCWVDAIEDVEYICQPPASGTPPADCLIQTTITIQSDPIVSTRFTCPFDYRKAPDDETKCQKGFGAIQTVDAVATDQYRCPGATTGSPDASDPYCQRPVPVQEEVEPIEETTYSCPAGSSGTPSEIDPYCQLLTNDKVDAVETLGYECPVGYSASGVVNAGTECVSYRSVPATVVEVDYSCPDGASGSPSANNPTCTWTSSQPVDAVEETIYTCPSGSSGEPNAGDPYCVEDVLQ